MRIFIAVHQFFLSKTKDNEDWVRDFVDGQSRMDELPPDREIGLSILNVDHIVGVNDHSNGVSGCTITVHELGRVHLADDFEDLASALSSPVKFSHSKIGSSDIGIIMDLVSGEEIDEVLESMLMKKYPGHAKNKSI